MQALEGCGLVLKGCRGVWGEVRAWSHETGRSNTTRYYTIFEKESVLVRFSLPNVGSLGC